MGRTEEKTFPQVVTGSPAKYLPQLDGVRAVAVLVVLAHHASVPLMKGGYLGVDVFFVLSGYLITAILLRELSATGALRLFPFYAKRALRLFPALITVSAAVALVWALLDWAPNRQDTLLGVPVAITYFSSWVRAFDINTLGSMGHTWSLAVEEHFYLVWPLVLILMFKLTRNPRMAVLIAAAIGIAYRLAAPVLFGWDTERIYSGSDTQAAQILIGCLLAAWLHETSVRVRAVPAVIAALGVGTAVVLLPLHSAFYLHGGALLVGLATAVVIAHLVTAQTQPMSRILQRKTLTWIGVRSYGIYLWHFPIFGLLAASGLPTLAVAGLSAALSFAIPALSYRFIESPILKQKKRFHTNLGASVKA